MQVKLLAQDGELYIFAESRDRVAKERAMRRRRLKKLWRRLGALREQKLGRDQLYRFRLDRTVVRFGCTSPRSDRFAQQAAAMAWLC
jgi:hypothetical protein